MARKKKSNTLDNLLKTLENADVEGIAVILLSKDGTITIGSEGLDAGTTESLLRQSASLLNTESGTNQTIH